MRVLELHMGLSVIKRAGGKNGRSQYATAASAYINRDHIFDERTGVMHSFHDKGEHAVEHRALIVQDNAPAFAQDRKKLWNEVEKREKHPRAQPARIMVVSFPYEFTQEQRIEAGNKISQAILSRYGGAVETAWHLPDEKGDHRNFHGHFLFTTRRFDEQGKWAKTKDRLLDDRVKGPEEIRSLRGQVAGIMNEIATRERYQIFVEHLSFQARGIEREPTVHLGAAVSEFERRGIRTEIGDKNREITARNQRVQDLERRKNVIDIALAREKMQARKGGRPMPTQGQRFQAFYRDSYERRAVMQAEIERQYAPKEKQLQQEAAQLSQEIDSAGFFTGMWRKISGKTKADREKLARAREGLKAIARAKDERSAALERDRLERLELLKREHQEAKEREERRVEDVQERAKAVGDNSGGAEWRKPEKEARARDGHATKAAEARKKADRREYFRKKGVQRQRREKREAEPLAGRPEREDVAGQENRKEAIRDAVSHARKVEAARVSQIERDKRPAPIPNAARIVNARQDWQLAMLGHFYEHKTQSRLKLESELDQYYGENERALRQEIAKHEAKEGRSSLPRDEQERVKALRMTLQTIEQRKTEARAALEAQITEQTERLRKRYPGLGRGLDNPQPGREGAERTPPQQPEPSSLPSHQPTATKDFERARQGEKQPGEADRRAAFMERMQRNRDDPEREREIPELER